MSAPLTHSSDQPLDPEIGPDVVARVRAGDRQAFEKLFFTYADRLMNIACGYLGSEGVAEDAVQDAFAQLWARRAHWVVRTSVRAYLYAAVRNVALKKIRRDRIADRYADGLERGGGAMGTWNNSADAVLMEGELETMLLRAVQSLAPRVRQAHRLRVEHELSHAEIAEAMGITAKAVEKLIARARAHLHDALLHYR